MRKLNPVIHGKLRLAVLSLLTGERSGSNGERSQLRCHPDRSAAKGRDPLSAIIDWVPRIDRWLQGQEHAQRLRERRQTINVKLFLQHGSG